MSARKPRPAPLKKSRRKRTAAEEAKAAKATELFRYWQELEARGHA